MAYYFNALFFHHTSFQHTKRFLVFPATSIEQLELFSDQNGNQYWALLQCGTVLKSFEVITKRGINELRLFPAVGTRCWQRIWTTALRSLVQFCVMDMRQTFKHKMVSALNLIFNQYVKWEKICCPPFLAGKYSPESNHSL